MEVAYIVQIVLLNVATYFVVITASSFQFLPIDTLVTFSGYVLFYILTLFWIWAFLKKCVFNYRVSPSNKAVFITGCDRGFGHMLAKKLYSSGFKVFAGCYFPTDEGANELKNKCSGVHVVPLDVTNQDSVSKALDYVVEHLGNAELWAVVNNAGIYNMLDVELTDADEYQRMFDVNTLGGIRVTKAFLPLLRKSQGRVVTITSMAGKMSFPCISAYCTSKFATAAFCESLRQEIQPWGVKVITIEPELYRTSLISTDVLTKAVDKAWDKAPANIKADYGERYLQQFKWFVRRSMKLASPQVNQVINSLYDAITEKNPGYCYKPRYNWFRRLSAFVAQYQPREITDVEFRLISLCMRYPFPETSNNIRSLFM